MRDPALLAPLTDTEPSTVIKDERRRDFEVEPYWRHKSAWTKSVSLNGRSVLRVETVRASAHREMAFAHACRCWVAPAIHILFRDPVLSEILVMKGLYSASNIVQSQLLQLVDQFLQNQTAVDLEPLLDALAEYSPWLSRRRADGKRKAIQQQLRQRNTSCTHSFIRLTRMMTRYLFRLPACLLRIPQIRLLCTASLGSSASGFMVMDIQEILCTTLLAGRLEVGVSVVRSILPHL